MRSILAATPEPFVMPNTFTAEQKRQYESLRLRLLDAVEAYEIPQKAIAVACNVTQSTVSLVLRGKGLAVETLLRIAIMVKGREIKTADKLAIQADEARVRESFRVRKGRRAK